MSYTAPLAADIPHAWGTLHDPVVYTSTPVTSNAYPTSDLAIYCPLVVPRSLVVVKLYWVNGTAVSGNVDVGLFTRTGTRLVSTGTTAQAGTSTTQVVDITDTTISAGLYYIAVTIDNTTATLQAFAPAVPQGAAGGIRVEQLGAGGTLPTTATWTISQTLAFVPHIGLLADTTVT